MKLTNYRTKQSKGERVEPRVYDYKQWRSQAFKKIKQVFNMHLLLEKVTQPRRGFLGICTGFLILSGTG